MSNITFDSAKTTLNNSINAAMGVSNLVVGAIDFFFANEGNPVKLGNVLQAINATGYAEKQRESYNVVIGVIGQFTKYEIKKDNEGNRELVDGQWVVKGDKAQMIRLAKRSGVDITGVDGKDHALYVEKILTPMADKWADFKDSYTKEGEVNLFGAQQLTEAEKAQVEEAKEAKAAKRQAKEVEEFETKGVAKQREKAEKLGFTTEQLIMAQIKDAMQNDSNFSLTAFIEQLNALSAE